MQRKLKWLCVLAIPGVAAYGSTVLATPPFRFTPHGFNFTMAGWSLRAAHVRTAPDSRLDGDPINAVVRRAVVSGRFDTYERAPGELAALLGRLGIRSKTGPTRGR